MLSAHKSVLYSRFRPRSLLFFGDCQRTKIIVNLTHISLNFLRIGSIIFVSAIMFALIGGITLISHIYNLNSIKSKTVGDGQHGTARFLTQQEVQFRKNFWWNDKIKAPLVAESLAESLVVIINRAHLCFGKERHIALSFWDLKLCARRVIESVCTVRALYPVDSHVFTVTHKISRASR